MEMISDRRRCPRCGSPVPVTLSQAQLCPVCVLGNALTLPAEDDFELDTDPPYQTITVVARSAGGITYLATPVGPTRRVALKIVGPRSDVRDVVRRFGRGGGVLAFERWAGGARRHGVGPAADRCVDLA